MSNIRETSESSVFSGPKKNDGVFTKLLNRPKRKKHVELSYSTCSQEILEEFRVEKLQPYHMVLSSAGREHAWKTEKWHPPTFEPTKRQASLKGWKPHFLKFTLFAPENRGKGPPKEASIPTNV